MKTFFVYIMTNKHHTVFYTGITNDLIRRVYEHKMKFVEGFTKKYNIVKLVYYEELDNSITAITREKQIKDWRREKKLSLINKLNPQWVDLYNDEDFSLRSK